MTDVVVTVPKNAWQDWLEEGAVPGATYDEDQEYHWFGRGHAPSIARGERVYIVAHGRLRGFAPLIRIDFRRRFHTVPGWWWDGADWGLVRLDGAVAVTIPERIPGFRGYRYVWWEREREIPFPGWQTEDVALKATGS